jgi:[2Fe-2S] binding domain
VADRIDEAADRLYGLPLDEFVRERDATAKALRAEKERDAAKAVAALAKPSAGAWAVNAIARERPELRDELLAAGDAVRDAQDEAVAGKGAGALRDAAARQRAAIDAVLAAAAELEPGGRRLSRPALDRLRQTLQAAAGDDDVREAMSGNICRCGAYPGIVAAVQSVRGTTKEATR